MKIYILRDLIQRKEDCSKCKGVSVWVGIKLCYIAGECKSA